jgi:hypothetical protein
MRRALLEIGAGYFAREHGPADGRRGLVRKGSPSGEALTPCRGNTLHRSASFLCRDASNMKSP